MMVAEAALAEPGGVGIRAGSINDGYMAEVFARVRPSENSLFEFSGGGGSRDIIVSAVPVDNRYSQVSAMLAWRTTDARGSLYAGGGAQYVYREYGSDYGSPIFQVGAESSVSPDLGITLDYRYQIHEALNCWFGGLRVRF